MRTSTKIAGAALLFALLALFASERLALSRIDGSTAGEGTRQLATDFADSHVAKTRYASIVDEPSAARLREIYRENAPCLALPPTPTGIADVIQRAGESHATPSERANAGFVATLSGQCVPSSRMDALDAAEMALDVGDSDGAVLGFHALLGAQMRGLPPTRPDDVLRVVSLIERAALEHKDPRAFAALADLYGDGRLVARNGIDEYAYRVLFELSGAAATFDSGDFPLADANILRIDALEQSLRTSELESARRRARDLLERCCARH